MGPRVLIGAVKAGAAWSDVPFAHFTPSLPHVVTMSGGDVLDGHLRPFTDRPPTWLPAVADVLLTELRSGHDMSAARADFAVRLITLLGESIWASTPTPFVSVSGHGFSAEFIARGVEVHVEVSEPDETTIYVLEPGVEEWEGPLGQVPDGIEKWAWRLGHD